MADMLVTSVLLGGLYALIAQGLAVIFGVMRIINLAHGDFFILGAYAGWFFHELTHLSPLLGLPVVAVLGGLIGWVVGRAVICRLVDRPPLTVLLATFGLSLVIQTGLRTWFGATPRFTRTGINDVLWQVGGVSMPAVRVIATAVAVLMLLALVPFIRYTKSGRAMRAVAQNTEGARIVGIGLNSIYGRAMALGTAVVFVAGTLYGMTQAFFPFSGPQFTLKAFIIVVLAGASSSLWLLPAAVLLSTIEVFCATYVPGHGTSIGLMSSFVLVVLVLAVRASRQTNADRGVLI